MGWHAEVRLIAYVDGDEGSIYIDNDELFDYFHSHPEGHGFSLSIGPTNVSKQRKRYWLNSTGRCDFS